VLLSGPAGGPQQAGGRRGRETIMALLYRETEASVKRPARRENPPPEQPLRAFPGPICTP